MYSQSILRYLPEIALAAALAWGSGLRLYAVLFLIGLSGLAGWMDLPPRLVVLAHPLVLGASGFMTLVEFGADKLPWLDSLWDACHTFIRVPAGAALAAAVFGASDFSISIAAAILGGTIAASTHFTKAGARATLNASPEPFTNLLMSFSEDILVPAGIWFSVAYPVAFLSVLALFMVLAILLLRAMSDGLAAAVHRLRTWKRPPGID